MKESALDQNNKKVLGRGYVTNIILLFIKLFEI